MAYYVGLDVSFKETSIYIIDDKGVVAARTGISTDPDLIAYFVSKHASAVEWHSSDLAHPRVRETPVPIQSCAGFQSLRYSFDPECPLLEGWNRTFPYP